MSMQYPGKHDMAEEIARLLQAVAPGLEPDGVVLREVVFTLPYDTADFAHKDRCNGKHQLIVVIRSRSLAVEFIKLHVIISTVYLSG